MVAETGLLDAFFAERVLKGEYSEEGARFLSTLMRVSRQGDLCWENREAPPLPSFVVSEGKQIHATTPIVRHEHRYYLQRNWVYESSILDHIKRLRTQKPPPFFDESLFRREIEGVALSPLQKKVVEEAFELSFALICGGPGTGKTYTAGVFVRLLTQCSSKKLKVILAAPTGKAASHLEATLQSGGPLAAQIEVMTLHRLLRLKPGENRLFSERKVDADLLIVDEASMIDVSLLAHLLEAVGSTTRLVMMGDPDQLPPVEASGLFSEMAALFATSLKGSMRTDKVHLHAMADGINRGEFPFERLLPWPFDQTLGGKVYQAVNPLLSRQELDPDACLQELNRFRVLGALRQGPFGIDQLNRYILQEMGKRIRPGHWWAIPIMVTSNDVRLELYNGTCGVLIGRSRGGVELRDGVAYFPERVPFKELPPFEVAFCLSIHKSQGSEFDRVLALFPQGSENFGRESLYTAVTRAKSGVEIVGEEKTLRAMLLQRSKKVSGFTERMKPSC